MSEESSPQMVLRFRNPETHRMLQRVAEALGVPMDELAEAAIQQELAALAVNLEPNLQRTVELLGSFKDDPERDVEEFARAEVTFEDPLRARRAGAEDAYGIGAAFARHVERR
jgi:transcriptional regulator with XRE-family HTH domain